jgi:MerR family transcriptional regulator, light-induced transcriptional regulator
MIADFFEMAGWDVDYVGTNVPCDELVGTVIRHRAHRVAISITMGDNLDGARDLVRALRAARGAEETPVLVGGRPINGSPELCGSLGADIAAKDAREALARAEARLGRQARQRAALSDGLPPAALGSPLS